MPIEREVRFNGSTGNLEDPVVVKVPQGEHEVVFLLVTVEGISNARFASPYIEWDGGQRPSGIDAPEPSDGDLRLRLKNHNTTLGPDSARHEFTFVVLYEGVTKSLGNPDPAIINEPPGGQ